jgi:hypothetical protein
MPLSFFFVLLRLTAHAIMQSLVPPTAPSPHAISDRPGFFAVMMFRENNTNKKTQKTFFSLLHSQQKAFLAFFDVVALLCEL